MIWCMKDNVLSVGLTEDQINYAHNAQDVEYEIKFLLQIFMLLLAFKTS